MPKKYHIETKAVPPRRPRIGKFGVIDWREDCARCHNCVKKACVYDRYRQAPESVDEAARRYFAGWTPPAEAKPAPPLWAKGLQNG